MKSFAWMVTAALVLGAIPAAAEECGHARVLKQYRAAVAAADQTGFRALADEGFVPAQRRLGEALRQQGGNDSEAYWWLTLAAKRGDRAARNAAFALEPSIGMMARIDLDRKAEDWRSTPSACTTALVERRRAGGSIPPQEFVEKLAIADSVGRPRQEVIDQLGRLLFHIADTQPDFLPYLTALGNVGIAPIPAAARVDESPNQPPALIIDSNLLAAPDQAKVPAVMSAMRDAVHRLAEPTATAAVDYRGRHVMLHSGDRNEGAMALIRQAIDLAETLPPDLRAFAAEPRQLVVEQTRPGEEKRAIATLMVKKGERDGFVRFTNLPSSHSAVDVAVGLVNTGVRLARLKKGLPDSNGDADDASERARKILIRS